MENFKNKVVWITGASSGIGRALALQLDALGAKLILSSRKEDALKSVEKDCENSHKILTIDLSDSSNFEEKTKAAINLYGQIDCLINNGGVSQRGEAHETSLEIDRRIMEVNYFGNVALTKSLLPHFHQMKQGRIIVISSLSGKFGFFLRSAYAASKFALVGFYESLRLEEEKNSIKVHLVFPGFINTNMSQNALSSDGKVHGKLDNNQNKGITPDECAIKLIKGVNKNKRDIFIGGKEMMALKVQRLFPNLFHKIIKKQSAT